MAVVSCKDFPFKSNALFIAIFEKSSLIKDGAWNTKQ